LAYGRAVITLLWSSVDVPSMPVLDSRRNTLGVLWAVYGIICVIKVAWIAINAPILTLMWGAIINRVPNPFAWMSFFHFMLVVALAELVLAAVFSLLAAATLMARSGPARLLALVAAFLSLVTGPLGLALGVYTIVLLLPRAAGERYGRLAAAA
jgi:hypothetical protein